MTDQILEPQLFSWEREPTRFLRDRYGTPPFTVLDRRSGDWIGRDRKWKSLGIQSELGRRDDMTLDSARNIYRNWYQVKAIADAEAGRPLSTAEVLETTHASKLVTTRPEGISTSIFSPTLAELAYRWYSRPGDRVLDPFAGGSVRGVVASALARWYTGVDLSEHQVKANRDQAHLAGDIAPEWITGDAAHLSGHLSAGYEADMVLSCPPYAHLERYTDDPRDLSTMDYPAFLRAYRSSIRQTVEMLRPDRFIAWVIGEVRTQGGDGHALGLVPDTVKAFQDAGAHLYTDHIILTPTGTAALRAPRQFDASRKAVRTHEYMLIFVKGDGRTAAKRLGSVPDRPLDDLDEDIADQDARDDHS